MERLHVFGITKVQPATTKDIPGISRSTAIYQGYFWYMLNTKTYQRVWISDGCCDSGTGFLKIEGQPEAYDAQLN